MAGTLNKLVTVPDNVARLALTIDDVNFGDIVKEEDTGLMYFVKDVSKLGTKDAFDPYTFSPVKTLAKIRPRRGTDAAFTSKNPLLEEGEMIFVVPDTGVGTGPSKIKIGDGENRYVDLPYAIGIHDFGDEGTE